MNCTVFSIRESDLAKTPGDATSADSLPGYDDASVHASHLSALHALELGVGWSAVHRALGEHPVGHPLGFLAGGGEPVPSLADGAHSSGRFFSPVLVVQILAAVAQITQPPRELERLRVFLGEAVAADRGIVVHTFG
ncbi:MAG: hypothetical protein JWO36_2095 [Myxococcales bacterium]|nr:hypothetical protein [Myxococcales bacterium]